MRRGTLTAGSRILRTGGTCVVAEAPATGPKASRSNLTWRHRTLPRVNRPCQSAATGVGQQRIERHGIIQVVGDHPSPGALTAARSGEPHFPDAPGLQHFASDDIPGAGIN